MVPFGFAQLMSYRVPPLRGRTYLAGGNDFR
jgi:hypothetical protein